jgi:hypothetical protein
MNPFVPLNASEAKKGIQKRIVHSYDYSHDNSVKYNLSNSVAQGRNE